MAEDTERIEVINGSGNVFADLGFENPEEELVKADLVIAISQAIEAKKLTQAKVAKLIGIDQPQVSRLLRGHTSGYSSDRLFRILNHLGQDVEIRVSPAEENSVGRIEVSSESPQKRAELFVAEERKTYGEKPKK